MAYRNDYGRLGEERAVRFLEDMGHEIVTRNFRAGKTGEIDIVARKEGLLLFVEVKRRSTGAYGGGIHAVNPRKKSSLRRVAQRYLESHRELASKEITCRFDLIAIDEGDVEWVQDILR